jgi:DNA polymerase I-like protein with 3'-5' exonuclease and polymerase domains
MTGWNIEVPTTEYYGHLPGRSDWAPGATERFQSVLNEIAATPIVALDTETTGLSIAGTGSESAARPLYFSLAWGNRRATLHADLLRWFTPHYADPRKWWVFANAKFDAHMLYNANQYRTPEELRAGVTLPRIQLEGKLVDTCVMHALLYEDKPHGLKYMCQHIGGWTWGDFQDQFGKITKVNTPTIIIEKAEQQDFPRLVEYAANDAWGTLLVYTELRKQLEQAGTHSLFRTKPPYISTLWDLFYKVEVPYTKALWRMERHGIRVDRGRLQAAKPEAESHINRLERRLTNLYGKGALNVNSTQQLQQWLVKDRGLSPLSMTKGGKTGVRTASVDEKFLKHHADLGDEACSLILEHRSYSKLLGTYIDGLNDVVDHDDRIHSRFNQDVARCMPAGELVLTDRGYLPVEQVRVNDHVITHEGRPRRVLETSKHAPQPIYVVELNNGLILKTTGNHQYLTADGWKRADDLAPGDEVVTHGDPEEWKKVRDWDNYSISSWGRVRNDNTGCVLTQHKKDKWGHLKVTLSRNGAQLRGADKKDVTVHRLVADAFCHARVGPEVRHLDGIAWNNTKENLLWGSSADNTADARAHGTLQGSPRLTKEQVYEILRYESAGQPPSSTAKLSYQIAESVRERYAAGEGRAELAKELGVSYQAIDNIVKDRTWTSAARGVSAVELADTYGVSPAAIRDIWAGRRWSSIGTNPECKRQFCRVSVESKHVTAEEPTYGLTVEEDHSHVTAGIVTHNTGRLSSSEPNLQNIPRPENDHWSLRHAFIPAPGYDLICFDYCVAPNTRILTSDLQWVTAEEVKVGEELIGFDEELGRSTRYLRTRVQRRKELRKACYQLTMSNGAVITCSHDHMWVVGGGGHTWKRRRRAWVKTEELEVGDHIAHFSAPWEAREGYNAGYVAGVLDGEGWVTKQSGTVGVAQRNNPCLTKLERVLQDYGVPYTKRNRAKDAVQSLYFTGNKAGLGVLGAFRPPRLLSKAANIWEGKRTWGHNSERVLITKIKKVGVRRVIALQTDAHTFIAEGFLSHNCQLEMRLLAAAALEMPMIEMIHAGKDIHIGNAEIVFGLPYDDIKAAKKKEKSELTAYDHQCLAARNAVKSIGFGILYGMGAPKMANDLGITEQEANQKIEQFLRAYPAVRRFTEEAVKETLQTGYAFTVLGRRRNVPEIMSRSAKERSRGERLAVNTQIQGSAADVVKMAQILYDQLGFERDYGCRMILQVHDELIFECPKQHTTLMCGEIKELMEHPFSEDLAVYLTAEGGTGASWGAVK